ncbi:hypothetical protein Tco_0104336 [Tanacetum coccineum]
MGKHRISGGMEFMKRKNVLTERRNIRTLNVPRRNGKKMIRKMESLLLCLIAIYDEKDIIKLLGHFGNFALVLIFGFYNVTAYNNPQGIIYLYKLKRNRLMHSDELYKFSDGTLTFVRSVLHDIASNLRMDYLSKISRSKLDRKRSFIMIKAIDQQLFERRLMRNLEKFIGGREYEENFRLLKRTI